MKGDGDKRREGAQKKHENEERREMKGRRDTLTRTAEDSRGTRKKRKPVDGALDSPSGRRQPPPMGVMDLRGPQGDTQ
ncbi:hypothetical protein E2C01_035910 [Portunus trituberculatus]|uniref:Uncharacterized protein n=1 Tax=Portunus trituberculatus TaxID=210409 RepID=A0A5B7F5L2_PORTR|nr:hypothetical protein [Portunus trituberculatus]